MNDFQVSKYSGRGHSYMPFTPCGGSVDIVLALAVKALFKLSRHLKNIASGFFFRFLEVLNAQRVCSRYCFWKERLFDFLGALNVQRLCSSFFLEKVAPWFSGGPQRPKGVVKACFFPKICFCFFGISECPMSVLKAVSLWKRDLKLWTPVIYFEEGLQLPYFVSETVEVTKDRHFSLGNRSWEDLHWNVFHFQ